MWPTTNRIGNWILLIIWIGLLPICISTPFHCIGVNFLFNLGNSLYILNFLFLLYFQFEGFESLSIWMILKMLLYNLKKSHMHHLRGHLMSHDSLHIIPLNFFLNNNSKCNPIVWFGMIGNLKWKGHVSKWMFCAQDVNIWPFFFKYIFIMLNCFSIHVK